MTRKFVSLTIFFSFLILFLTSIVLYFIPGLGGSGVWAFLGLGRAQWTDLHLTSGFLFLAFGLWHTIINWRGLSSGLKKLAAANFKAAWPVLAALALNAFIIVGTINHYQPVAQVLSIYQTTKQNFRKPPSANGEHRGSPDRVAEADQIVSVPELRTGSDSGVSETRGVSPVMK